MPWCRYKKHNTRSALVKLTDSTLLSLGIAEKDDRKSVLTAIRKANLSSGNETTNDIPKLGDISSVGTAALPSKPQTTKVRFPFHNCHRPLIRTAA